MIRNQKGQGMVEYILIVALVVIGGIAGWMAFGDKVQTLLTNSNNKLDGAITKSKSQ